jgi:hypothetical protein
MRPWIGFLALSAGTFTCGWFGVRLVVPARAHTHEHVDEGPPTMTEAEFEQRLASERPWLLPLRHNRFEWTVAPDDAAAETERLWDAAQPLGELDAATRDAVFAELDQRLAGARIRYESEVGQPQRRAAMPDPLLWALETSYAEARFQLDAFAAGRCRVLAMDAVPGELSSAVHDGTYLSEYLATPLEKLVLFRIEPDEDADLHELKTLMRRVIAQG